MFSPNNDRFWKLFHQRTLWKICKTRLLNISPH